MYGQPCARCGKLEVFHIALERKGDEIFFREPPSWLGCDCGEEPEQEEIDLVTEHQNGYKHNLFTCPGFEYSKKIPRSYLVERAMSYPSTIPYAEELVANEAKRRLQEIEDKRIASYVMPAPTMYLIPNRDRTHYVIFQGE